MLTINEIKEKFYCSYKFSKEFAKIFNTAS